MANNVNCEEIRFVIRNLVDVDDVSPATVLEILLDGRWNYVGISPEKEGRCSTAMVEYFPQL